MKSLVLASVILAMCLPAIAVAAPFKMPQPVSPDEDAVLAQRYGADYIPQTDAGKKAKAAAIKANRASEIVNGAPTNPCPGPSWTAQATCANDLRDKAAIANKFPWMDLIYAYDAKILQASVDADAKRIKKDELFARLKVAQYELQEAVTQRVQVAQAQLQAQQAVQAQQAREEAQQQAAQEAQLNALRAQQQAAEAVREQAEAAQRAAAWQTFFTGLAAMSRPAPVIQAPAIQAPITTNCYKVGFMVQCTTQ